MRSRAGTLRSPYGHPTVSTVQQPRPCSEVSLALCWGAHDVPVTGALNPPGWEMNNNSFKCTFLLQTMPPFPFDRCAWKTRKRSQDPVSAPDLPRHSHAAGPFPASGSVRVRGLPARRGLSPTQHPPTARGSRHHSSPGASTSLGTHRHRGVLRHLEKLPNLPHVNERPQHIPVHAQSSVRARGCCPKPAGFIPTSPARGSGCLGPVEAFLGVR